MFEVRQSFVKSLQDLDGFATKEEAMATDAQLARALAMLCDECEARPAALGYMLCTPCYAQRVPFVCTTCSTYNARGTYCTYCAVPNDKASYEEWRAWEASRNPSTGVPGAMSHYDTYKYKLADKESECSICLDALQLNEEVVTLACAHTFHAKCITKWVSVASPTCPTCNRDVRA